MIERVYLDSEKKVIKFPKPQEEKLYQQLENMNSARVFDNIAKEVINNIFDFRMMSLTEDLFNMGLRFTTEKDQLRFAMSMELARASLHINEGYDHRLWEVLDQLVVLEEEDNEEESEA